MKRILSAIGCFMLTITMLPTIALADDTLGGITITGGQSGTDYTLDGGVLMIQSSAPLTVSGSKEDFRIVVAGDKTANLTLSDAEVDMSKSTYAAIDLQDGATLNLAISGENTLKGGMQCAGISVPEGMTLAINGSGGLNVFGGMYGAGIGGGAITNTEAMYPDWSFYGVNAGTINISGGTVNAAGGMYAAGIGGGAGTNAKANGAAGGSGGTVTISGGIVNASAGAADIHMEMGEFGGGAGIGGGGSKDVQIGGSGGNITITGGVVNADTLKISDYMCGGGAAIGGGYAATAGSIIISGGTITAKAQGGAPGIGSGSHIKGSDGGRIEISGGNVTTEGAKGSAGIGAGWCDNTDSKIEIIILGGRVNATGGDEFIHPTRGEVYAGAGIGSGFLGGGSSVTISGGVVTAIGGAVNSQYTSAASAIGTGSYNNGTHSFSTGVSGAAVIITRTKGAAQFGCITDLSNESSWQGTIIQGTIGQVYGNQTIQDDFTIDADQNLIIPATASFTISEGVTVTNNGTIENNGVGRNSGTIAGTGTTTCNNHNWDEATADDPKTCAFCKATEGEHLPWIYAIAAAPETVSFGTAQMGYTQPEAQTITVTNTGNRSVTITLPTLAEYLITAGTGFEGTTAVLSPNGGTAAFNIQPEASLGTGMHTGSVDIKGSNDTGASVEATFEVIDTQMTEYAVKQGANGKWTKGSSKGLAFTADADYSKFVSVSVDGTMISDDTYTSESGSTIITLKASYLKTLAIGAHTLTINFTDGYAKTVFTIKAAAASGKSPIPQTDDTGNVFLWILLLFISFGGAVNIHVLKKKSSR